MWAAAYRENNIYFLQELHQGHMMYPTLGSEKQPQRTDTQDIEIWHRRMSHLNRKYISTLKSLADGVDFGTMRKYKLNCEECVTSNQRKQISRFPVRRPKTNLEIVYIDLCGPMQENDFWGHRYFSLIVCGRSKYKWLHLLLKKSDIQPIFRR